MTMTRQSLQAMIDATPDGETLVLPAGEYEGPVTLPRRLVLEGTKSTIWSRKGPVMRLRARGTCLRSLRIEVTHFDEGVANKPEHVALLVERRADVVLEDVVVRGYVVGIDGESGAWLVPPSIDLGVFAPRALNSFILRLFVPVPCQITTEIADLSIAPTSLAPGINEVMLTVENIYPDTLLLGRCYLRSAHFTRPVDVVGRAASGGRTPAANRRLLWEPPSLPAGAPDATGAADCNVPLDIPPDRDLQPTEQWLEDEINRLIRSGAW